MTDVSLDSEALGQLSRDQKVLLDCIDSLRSLGVGKLVNLPQIIVVGDQSSGKSSVLEAISRVRFPVKGGLCTRFATELVLRKKPKEELVVKIRANNPDRQPDFNERRFSKDDLPAIIEEAKKLMGVGDDASSFSEDTLRVEVSGPDLEPLTLVDLPGFYHAGTSDQSPEGISTVLRLVERYMKQKNSIILAVVSAKNEIVQQKVLGEVQKHDPMRERTMGIVTKPDTLTPGSLEEEKYVQLAKNQETSHIFKHGWHVLRNRDGQESDERNAGAERTSNESRDNAEKKFFDSGVWANYSSNNKGVGSLRHKLSKVLTKHIHLSLPGVIEDIENKLEAQQERLQSLGKARSNMLEIRQYLVDIAERLRDLTRIAVRGTYDGKFFTDLHMNDFEQGQVLSDQRKLRAVIRNLNRAFDTVISVRGSMMRIVGHDDIQFGNEQDRSVSESLRGWVDQFQVEEPVPISWTDLKARLELQASNNQGTQFPGSSNDRLALELFREQSQRWKDIAKTYIELAIDAAKAFVELILQHVILADENTRDAIFAEYVVPFFDERSSALEEKLDELLIHYQEGDAVCLEEEFRLRLSFQTKPRLGNQVQQLLLSDRPDSVGEITAADVKEAIANVSDAQVSEFGLEGVFDMMITYYEMSLRTFTDNVIILAVENCLISKMSTLFTPMMVLGMDDETLSRLAAESSEIRCERSDLQNDIAVLKSGLAICKKYQPRKSTPFQVTPIRSATHSTPTTRDAQKPLFTTQSDLATVAAPKDSKFTPVPNSFLGTAASNSVGSNPLKLGDSSDANPKTEAKSDEKEILSIGRGILGSSWSGFDSKKGFMGSDKTDGLSGRSIFATGPTAFSASVGNASGGMSVTDSNSDNKAVWAPTQQPFGTYAKGGGTAGSGLKIEPEDKANITTPRSALGSDSSAVSTTWDSTAKRKDPPAPVPESYWLPTDQTGEHGVQESIRHICASSAHKGYSPEELRLRCLNGVLLL